MNKLVKIISVLILFCSGCAGLQYDHETPTVSVTSFRALPTEGIVPRFEIGLLITNPNRTVLELKGITYSIEIEGYEILTGVSNKLPRVEAYSQGEAMLSAAPNLLRSIQLMTELMNRNKGFLHYAIDAKLDIGSMRPRIRIREEGAFSFGEKRNNPY